MNPAEDQPDVTVDTTGARAAIERARRNLQALDVAQVTVREPRPWARAVATLIVGMRDVARPPLPAWWSRASDRLDRGVDRLVDAVCDRLVELREAVRQYGPPER